MDYELTHLDLFSGIGGFAIAAQWAGFQTIAFSEIEPAACEILRRQFQAIPNAGDIRKLDGQTYSGISLLTGGFPCQPFSVAGKRRGKADDRHLWPEMLRIISEARPTWVVGENVAGIIQMELDNVLSDLEAIGYECAPPLVIPAVAVDARHRRDRIWIVANADVSGGSAIGENCVNGIRQDGGNRIVADAESIGRIQGNQDEGRDAEGTRETEKRAGVGSCCRWQPEPDVGRVANGISNRSHRLKGLGNAIVPQVAFEILRVIAEIELSNA